MNMVSRLSRTQLLTHRPADRISTRCHVVRNSCRYAGSMAHNFRAHRGWPGCSVLATLISFMPSLRSSLRAQ